MNTLLIILLLLAMGATAYVLVRGVIAMASGKDVSGERQQDYMRKRVLFQAVAIIIVILILVVAGASRGCRRRRRGQLCDRSHPSARSRRKGALNAGCDPERALRSRRRPCDPW